MKGPKECKDSRDSDKFEKGHTGATMTRLREKGIAYQDIIHCRL